MSSENWIKHDLDSRSGLNMSAFFKETGALGYGVFWVITEILYREENNCIANESKSKQIIANEANVSISDLEQILSKMCFYDLLQKDDRYIWRNRVNEEVTKRKEHKNKIKAIRAQVGAIGGSKPKQTEAKQSKTPRGEEIRGEVICVAPTHLDTAPPTDPPTEENSPDAPKHLTRQKDPLLKKAPHVWLSATQCEKLIEKMKDIEEFKYWVRKLNAYLDERPRRRKRYVNHARTISDWRSGNISDGLVFFNHPEHGWGYYKSWVIKDLQQGNAA